ncbi:MAG: hypothetical protein A3I39_02945 [Candidatus Yanofskybacteria bacterium RIFCSPLOWO2_02_FULL_47_9b]|uniref:Uncharacterized protein n=1 Tax=Candidatus Yanofskybacteria bacterium RIFCSPLOWO2_02_FULL_47_9b TaxID=1802708 RepID=A0A1F8H684_9BACT|nr:MAG: hypothetical protein A3I39_02945 [Candidatus Yanofskybacteria bacterium RIFCSPLOWO2_02_FULL_47_9b]
MKRRIKQILGWAIFVVVLGSVFLWTATSMYADEYAHSHSAVHASLVTVGILAGVFLGNWWSSKYFIPALKKAFIQASIDALRTPRK